ncbi:flagellar biosynthesis/type III secretory pathway chaperone [Scopulibacillus daqui]|uniref:Flagellar biosynthesis/type III secretory pathway chaperone n=1 Tax=Scopulibacillus daqui TaxID=1469162 RepID=A0ABS2PYB2_9BACL|nr:flagellar export chaperone FlgN [Scopulibacillus daqui]MBM7645039.1 flagellar biosynthesis/type III secretory pathway chaperone [Scopulibacillus daqui]
MVEELIKTLKAMINEFQTLNQQSEMKMQAIKNGNAEQLSQIIKLEEAVLRRIEQLEKTREAQILRIVEKSHLPADSSLSFSSLLACVPFIFQDQLKRLRLELVQQIDQLKGKNDLNQQLIRESLQWIHLNLHLLKPQLTLENYQPSGKGSRQEPALARIDSRV